MNDNAKLVKSVSDADTSRMIKATLPLLRWMNEHDISRDGLVIYTRQQWEMRGEDTCNGADAVIVFEENDLYSIMRGEWGWARMESLYEVISKAGYFLEQGYSWNAGIYKEV